MCELAGLVVLSCRQATALAVSQMQELARLLGQHLLDAKSQMQQSAKAVEQSKAVIDASQTPGGGDGGGGGGGGADGGGGVKTDDM